jgi:hypothetical protein
VVDFSGGQGFLLVTDIDTVVQAVLLLAALAVVYRRRDALRDNRAFVTFVLVLTAGLWVSMAYVVTNYGTMFRLRPIAMLPIWLLPLATLRHAPDPRQPETSSG